jgi:hypothetical protein
MMSNEQVDVITEDGKQIIICPQCDALIGWMDEHFGLGDVEQAGRDIRAHLATHEEVETTDGTVRR